MRTSKHHTITVQPTRVAAVLSVVAVVFILLSIAGQVVTYFYGEGWMLKLAPELYLDEEHNIPTFFASALLLLTAGLLGLIASWKRQNGDAFRWHWAGLAVLFVLMAVDESATLHEGLVEPTRTLLGVGGWFYFAWIIPALLCLFVLSLLFFRFFLHLETPFRGIFLLAGLIYVGGAVGVESLGGRHVEVHGINNFSYSLIATVEESMELFGIILFVYGLLRYLDAYVTVVHVHYAEAGVGARRYDRASQFAEL